MGFFASLIAYLAATTGIVVAFLMGITVFFAAPGPQTITRQTSTIASRPTSATAGNGQWEPSVTPGIAERRPDLPIKSTAYTRSRGHTAGKQLMRILARREPTRPFTRSFTRPLADQQTTDFEVRFMGYAGDPAADHSLLR
jgi:uncharacterized iron-regulated membrane protein